jgi:hypothetical protein
MLQCPKCGLYQYWMPLLDGFPTTIELHAARRAQVVTALVNGQAVFREKVLWGKGLAAQRTFTVANPVLLARALYKGEALADHGVFHLEHPHRVTALATRARGHTRASVPDQPPF